MSHYWFFFIAWCITAVTCGFALYMWRRFTKKYFDLVHCVIQYAPTESEPFLLVRKQLNGEK